MGECAREREDGTGRARGIEGKRVMLRKRERESQSQEEGATGRGREGRGRGRGRGRVRRVWAGPAEMMAYAGEEEEGCVGRGETMPEAGEEESESKSDMERGRGRGQDQQR
eukprot:3656554-Rhodomonas_salina.1